MQHELQNDKATSVLAWGGPGTQVSACCLQSAWAWLHSFICTQQ